MFCFDTNAVIAAIKGMPSRFLERFDREVGRGTVEISSVVLFEMQYGIAKSTRRQANAERLSDFLQSPVVVLPFDAEDAEEAGDLRASLERAGTPIGPYDILIAAQARRRGAVLVTANTREFARVPGLKIENWTNT